MPLVWIDFIMNLKNSLKNHTWTFVCKGKIDPKINNETNGIFVFYFDQCIIPIVMLKCVLHHVASGSVNPVQSNVNAQK